MADLSGHKKSQEKEITRLQAEGRRVGVKIISHSTTLLMAKAAQDVLQDSGLGALGEAAADLGVIRSDKSLLQSVAEDVEGSKAAVLELLYSVMEDALTSEMAWQTTQIKGLKFELTDQDRKDMKSYPIQGHTINELVEFMHNSVVYEVSGIVAAPLTGDVGVRTIGPAVDSLCQRFAERVATAVQEVYLSGAQMAVRMVAGAFHAG